MGLQLIGLKKMRKARAATNLDIVRLLCASNHAWYAIVRWNDGHRHAAINPRTWEWEWNAGCFTTCSEGMWGPYIDAPGVQPPPYAAVYR